MQRKLRLVSIHGEATGPPVEEIDDRPLKKTLDSVTKGGTCHPHWRFVLQSHEAEALFQVLKGRVYTQERLKEAIEFLWMIDQQNRNTGWTDERLRRYVRQAARTLEVKPWAENLLNHLQESITLVKQRTGQTFFRRELLAAALLFFYTGHQEQVPQRATG
ncbi:hypothetical protein HYV70_01945 [Candidatus Uhrbacteria bacterium]|nr:hypothetical protein [Candidatus Uhrbacteria bacterium]